MKQQSCCLLNINHILSIRLLNMTFYTFMSEPMNVLWLKAVIQIKQQGGGKTRKQVPPITPAPRRLTTCSLPWVGHQLRSLRDAEFPLLPVRISLH